MNTARHILTIAQAYSDATGISLPSLARQATGTRNNVVFSRIAAGKGCSTTTLDAMLAWFDENWPDDVPWPDGVLRRPVWLFGAVA